MKKEILEVRLKGNCADTRDGVLRLGGAQSYGIYRLHITADEAWQGLAIAATFDCGGSPVTVFPAEDGLLDVPAEATASANTSCHPGSITFWGSNGDVRRVSARLLYRVYPTGSITGGNAIPPTPEVAEQLLARLDGKLDTPANTGAAGQVPVLQPDGSTLWGSVAGGTGTGGAVGADGGYYTPSVDDAGNLSWTASKTDMPAVNGANIMGPAGADGQPGADGAPGPVGATPNIQIGTVETLAAGSAATASMTGTAENPMLNLGIPKGADGQPGADGKDGLDGSPGADGKSAYQYAQDGGYTGTEAEFAAKLAQEKFANPNALTFTGALEGRYDGSAPLSVEIPSGGGGGAATGEWRLVCDITLEENISKLVISEDSDGNPLSLSLFTALIESAPIFGSNENKVCTLAIGNNASDIRWGSKISVNLMGAPKETESKIYNYVSSQRYGEQILMRCARSVNYTTSPNDLNSGTEYRGGLNFESGELVKAPTAITHLGLVSWQNPMLGAGSRIRIWGVDA